MTTWPATFPGRWLRHFLSVYFRVRARDAVAVLQTLKQDSAASLLTLRPSTSSSAAGGYRLLPGLARSRSTAPFGPASDRRHFLAECFRVAAAPGYWSRSPAAGRSGESPAGPGSGGGRGSFLLPSSGASSAAVPG